MQSGVNDGVILRVTDYTFYVFMYSLYISIDFPLFVFSTDSQLVFE